MKKILLPILVLMIFSIYPTGALTGTVGSIGSANATNFSVGAAGSGAEIVIQEIIFPKIDYFTDLTYLDGFMLTYTGIGGYPPSPASDSDSNAQLECGDSPSTISTLVSEGTFGYIWQGAGLGYSQVYYIPDWWALNGTEGKVYCDIFYNIN